MGSAMWKFRNGRPDRRERGSPLLIPEGGFFLHTGRDSRDKLTSVIRVKAASPRATGKASKCVSGREKWGRHLCLMSRMNQRLIWVGRNPPKRLLTPYPR